MFDNNTTIFVKGFRAHNSRSLLTSPPETSPFLAVLTNLDITKSLEVSSASKDANGKWVLHDAITEDTYIFEQEPKTPRLLKQAKLVQNFRQGINGPTYDEVILNETSRQAVSDGKALYQLIGRNQTGAAVCTSDLVKLWVSEEGVNHAMTASGSHYIFE